MTLTRNLNKFNAIALAVTLSFSSNQVFAAEDAGSLKISVKTQAFSRAINDVNLFLSDRSGNNYELQSTENGLALFKQLPPGLYDLKAEKDGYVTVVENSIRITRDKITSVNLLLPKGDDIEVISVIATQTANAPSEPVSTSYMNREALRSAIGGGSDVLRALDGMPGLTSTGEFASFSVRGRGPRDNLIYVDNMPFDKVVHFDASLGELEDVDGGGRFSIFAPNMIEGAYFSPGGWGAAYGGKAGSLLRLDVIEGGATPTASIRFDIAGFEVGYEGPSGFDDDTQLVFNARQLDFGRLFEVIGEEDIGEPVLSDVLLKTTTEVNPDNSIEFLFLYSPEEYRRDLEHVAASVNFEEVEVSYNEQDSTLVGFTWNTLLGEDSELRSNVYYRNSDKFTSQGESYPDLVPEGTPFEDFPVRRDILTFSEKETELGLRFDFTTLNRFGEFSAGAEARRFDLDFFKELSDPWIRYIYEQDDFRPDPSQKYIVLQPEFIDSQYAIKATSYAAYAEQEFQYNDWQFNTGLRYDRDELSDENLLSPRLNISWSPVVGSQYTFTSGIFYQAPSFVDRASSEANRSLQNERIAHFSVGGNWRLTDTYNLLAEVYYQQLDKLVVDGNRTDGDLSNNGEGTTYGLDTVLTRYFDNGWSAIATYSYNDARLDDMDGEGEYDADFNRPHVFTLGAQWEINKNWKVGARWKYFTGTPTDEFTVNENVLGDGNPLRFSQEYTTNNTIRENNFHQLNVRVDYFKTLGPVNVIAFLDIVNVLATPSTGEEDFIPTTGLSEEDDGDVFPQIGLKFETTF
ncbi:TonB-dependent receptor [Thalassotalea sp. PS06]|uniref:TonB-dependent receptor n=1 Tax=Thalassotalea sp. PS06 TaxID=2594005 RepID=UPI0011646054|nr:TonB-dependent receptor [Thalassotalea sp. PS06]QDP00541.1 TonB-dependent receptor [Thalassotalea sp. PS06]